MDWLSFAKSKPQTYGEVWHGEFGTANFIPATIARNGFLNIIARYGYGPTTYGNIDYLVFWLDTNGIIIKTNFVNLWKFFDPRDWFLEDKRFGPDLSRVVSKITDIYTMPGFILLPELSIALGPCQYLIYKSTDDDSLVTVILITESNDEKVFDIYYVDGRYVTAIGNLALENQDIRKLVADLLKRVNNGRCLWQPLQYYKE